MPQENSQRLNLRPSRRGSYRDLFDRMREPVFLLDDEAYKIVDCNPSAETIFKAQRTDLLGLSFAEWLDPDNFEKAHSLLRRSRRGYYSKNARFHWNLKDGARIFDTIACSLALAELPGGEGTDSVTVLQVILQDVTREAKVLSDLEEISIRDEMTKLANYRYFMAELTREHERAVREGGSYALLFCDVDNFKNYNDRMGHLAGDALLRQLGLVIMGTARGSDLAARYGGEEFVVLCRGTAARGAFGLGERIRRAVEEFPFEGREGQPLGKVSLSIGVAGYPTNGTAPEEIINCADQALYRAKNSGRNQVTLFHLER